MPEGKLRKDDLNAWRKRKKNWLLKRKKLRAKNLKIMNQQQFKRVKYVTFICIILQFPTFIHSLLNFILYTVQVENRLKTTQFLIFLHVIKPWKKNLSLAYDTFYIFIHFYTFFSIIKKLPEEEKGDKSSRSKRKRKSQSKDEEQVTSFFPHFINYNDGSCDVAN